MDRRQIGVRLVLKQLGVDFDLSTFKNRLIIQKTIYLAQTKGVNLGYYYQWYLHGPYCPALTRDIYDIEIEASQGIDEWKLWHLSDELGENLSDISRMIKRQNAGDLPKHLELLSSVHFLIERKRIQRKDRVDQIRKYKPQFGPEQIEKALEEIAKYGLIAE